MLNIHKNKALSKLIALTFAFNTLTPVAFASEDATTSSTTSSGLSLKTVNNDILTRIATTASSNFKSRNLNISDTEINNLMNIPLSTSEEESYLTQEEKDYNNLQLLIAQGLNTKEARATALNKLEQIEALSKSDESIALTSTEKYIKSLLENYEDIESRAGASNAIGSAITTTDSSMAAYKTILKVAKAERLACRNDALSAKAKADKGETLAEGTNTDPDKCELSAKGKEAAQMLTYLSNSQVNQTTDSKKTTDATNSTTNSNGERKCETAGTTLAVNDNTRCCPTQQPFYNSSTAKCVASLGTTNSTSNKDDDDDDTSNTALMQYLMSQQQNCQNTDGALNIMEHRCTIPTTTGGNAHKFENEQSPNTKKSSGSKNKNKSKDETKILKSGNSKANQAIMSRISDINIEFNEKNKDDRGNYVHVNDSNSEYKVTVNLEEKESTKENENPLFIKVYATQYVGEDKDNATLYRFTQTAENGVPVTIVYPETMKPSSDGAGHFIKKVLGAEEYYTLAITITDGTYESSPFYVKYRIVDTSTKLVSNDKDQTSTKISIMGKQGKIYDTETTGNASLDVNSAKYENGVCKLSVSGALVTSSSGNAQKIPATEYDMDNINEADCIKLNEDAKNNKLHLTANNAQIQETMKDGTVSLKADSDVLPAFSLDGGENYLDTKDYLTSTEFDREETSYDIADKIPMGQYDGKNIYYSGESIKIEDANGNFTELSNKQLSEMLNVDVPENAYTELSYDKDGKIQINVLDENDKVITAVTTNEIAEKTVKQIKTQGLDNATAKAVDRVVNNFKNATIKVLGGSVVAEATSEGAVAKVTTKAKEAFNNIKKVNASNTNKIEVSKTAPATIENK